MKSRNRLLIALTSILALAFVGGSFINYMITRAAIHQEILSKDLPLTMDNIYSDLTAELMRPILVSSSMAADTFLKDWALDGERDSGKVTRYLQQMQEKYGFFTAFFISAKTRTYYHYKGILKTIQPTDPHDVWYYNLINSDKEYDLDVDTDEASNNTLTIFINNKVFAADGRLLGITGVGLKVDNAAKLVRTYREKYQRAVYLTDMKGLIQVHQNLSFVEKKNIRDIDGLAPFAADILKAGDTAVNIEYRHDGELILLTARYIAALDWMLYVEQNETKTLAGARMTFLRTVLIGLAASIFIIGLTLLTINRYHRQLERLIVTDELTGVANRRRLETEFAKAVYNHSRLQHSFSLILMDLDGFKKVNDTLGHQAGDAVLIAVAGLVGAAIRPTDTLARWGGDEFVVLAISNGDEAWAMAERIRLSLVEADLAGPGLAADDPRNCITVSCGLSEFEEGDSLDRMLSRSDQALYVCKSRGGNCVIRQDPDCRSSASV